MFENIIGLESVTNELRNTIASGSLPRAILLAGPRYGAKSTIALEIARTLTCHGKGEWGCSCRSCALHRTLSHPDLVCAGPRYFDLEIAAALQAYRTTPRPGTLFLLIRAVRKLVRRFDAFLWTETRYKKIQPALDAVESIVQEMEPGPEAMPAASGEAPASGPAQLKKLETSVNKLLSVIPREIVPIDLVRALSGWTRVSSAGGTKVAVIEEVHTLQEGARNSMLKLLEEPPGGVHLILTTTRRSAIIPTILSRLRTYTLPERSPTEQTLVQEKIFRLPADSQTDLPRFFRGAGDGGETRRRELAEHIVDTILAGGDDNDLVESVQQEIARSREEFLLEELTEEARRRLRTADPAVARRLHRWGSLINAYHARVETRNMNPAATVAGLVLALQRDDRSGEN